MLKGDLFLLDKRVNVVCIFLSNERMQPEKENSCNCMSL